MNDMPNLRLLSLSLHDPLRVVGTNPEMADYDNPRGEIIAPVYSIQAEALDGRRWVHYWSTPNKAAAERLLERCRAWGVAGNFFHSEHWLEVDPAYGSPAYQAAEVEIVADERRRDREGW